MDETTTSTAPATETATPAPDSGPKVNADVTIVIREGELRGLRVEAIGDITYAQLKEICVAGAQRVDMEFTAHCREVGALNYKPVTAA